FNMLTSISTVQKRMEREAWNGNNYYSYLLLDERADLAVVNEKLKDLSKQYISEDGFELFNLQPLTAIHLHSDMTFEPEVHGSARAVNFLYLISVFILLIAWINYINLSTARAVERAREVGMRKVVGARKIQLIGQFFTEALLVNLLGVLLAILLVQLALPYFNQLVGKTVMTAVEGNPVFLKNLLIFFVLGTLVTGIYPSMILSSFKPIGVLKGSFNRSKHGVALRKGLVIFQFTTSLVLIVGTIVIYQQIQYMMGREMGMKNDQVLSFNAPGCPGEFEQCKSRRKAFQNELKQLKGVRGVANMACLPGGRSSDINSTYGEFSIPGAAKPIASTLYINFMDDQLVDLLDLKVAAGRNFDFQLASDSNAVLINQAMLDLFDISNPEAVINKELVRTDGFRFRIVGVLEDFNRSTLKYTIEPTFFVPNQISDFGLVKIDTDNISSTIAAIEKNYLRFFPDASFNPVFLDDRFAQLYVEDQKFGSVFSIFSVLAIFVAMMGLFGLAAFLSLQRTKEVGIRKVLGASTWQIIVLFFRDFVGLVLVGLILGAPLVYYGMDNWLSTYAFRIDFPWWSLLLGMVALMLLTFLTVSFQTYRVASINPADTMRTE
ncbi:MAG: FtsX-like permease family protein, partial [Bacteroidota bacterium]